MKKSSNIVIIGAGLGGLTAGALLSKDGYKVTILEQHNIVGGCATTFKRKGGFICEVGLHEMDGVYNNRQIKYIFDKLDVYNNVNFIKPNEFFSIKTKNRSFIMPDSVELAQQKLIEQFPKEKQGIVKYFKNIKSIYHELEKLQDASWYHYALFPFLFPNTFKFKPKSVTKVLDSLIEDEELKFILNANVQYYADTPDSLSFLLHAVAQYSYYSGGGYFIQGGSQKLSDYLASVIVKNGGNVITKAEVISCKEGLVTYMNKNSKISLSCDAIVSNLSTQQTYKLLNHQYQEKLELSNSLLTIYIGFKKNLKEIYGKRAYSNFIFDDTSSIDEYNSMIKQDITSRGFVFVDYSQIDSKLTKDNSKSFGVICLTDFIDEWINLDDSSYYAKKDLLIESAIEKLQKYYPNIKDLVEFAEVGTAKTVKRYIKTPQGTAYGFKPTPKQFLRIPQTKSKKINSLYFVGQWVLSGGFSPSITSGLLCYKEIVKS